MFKIKKLSHAIYLAAFAVPVMGAEEDSLESLGLEELKVTATRRSTTVQDVPYNISAYGGKSLADAGITEFSKIARSIPGLSLTDVGRSKNGISNGIVMRGLNITGAQQEDFALLTDPVVSVYLGETPLFANFELRDMERVEVLRGPQATLYGSGSLGGTMKYIPASPDIDELSGNVKVKAAVTDESDDLSTDFEGTINIPLTDKLAFRGTVAQVSTAGYVDSDYIEGLDSDGQPTGETRTVEDLNDEDIQMLRGSLLFAPSDDTDITLMYNYQKDDIGGSSATAEGLDGYESGTKVLEEFEREVSVASLVVRQNLGFAELTSATSLSNNEAESIHDQSYNYGYQSFWAFYAGVPREVVTGDKTYDTSATTQEFRLVSTGDGNLDWIAGAYYNKVEFDGVAYDYIAGIDDFYAITNPQLPDLAYSNILNTEFEDRAIFGELTYHVNDVWQVTLGARHFDQDFYAFQSITLPPCGVFCGDGPTGLSEASDDKNFSDTLFKFNTSYDFSDKSKMYFTVAEGFRHGGANGVPIDDLSTTATEGGVFAEHPDYLFFDPDKSVNYEVGLKGYLTDRVQYNASLFYIDWENPILLLQTPNGGFPAMFNGEAAVSKGIELETKIILSESFDLKLGYTYTNAELSEDFNIPGISGGVESSALGGQDGDKLPGVPETTANIALSYSTTLEMGADLNAEINASYKDGFDMGFDEPSALAEPGFDEIDSSTLVNARIGLNFSNWSISLYADNLFNAEDITASDGDARYNGTKPGVQYDVDLADQEYKTRPRTIGLGLSYDF